MYSQLEEEEFAQSGGIRISVARPGGGANVSSLVLARWLSLTYMTLAQLGAVFPGRTPPPRCSGGLAGLADPAASQVACLPCAGLPCAGLPCACHPQPTEPTVPHRARPPAGAMGQDGFAWVTGAASLHEGSESTTLEAYGLADFVLHTIR